VNALAGLRIALAQVNPTVGDIDGNAAMVADWIERARSQGAGLVVFPELCIPGYPAEDLYLKRHFGEANRRAVEEIAAGVSGITAVVGFAEPLAEARQARPDAPSLRPAYNALAVIADGEIRAVYRKNRLPNYSVFDERRYFEPGVDPRVIELAGGGAKVGLTICEDVWEEGPPASVEAEQGAGLIVNPSGSPYHRGKGSEREQMFVERARRYRTAFAFCNLVGGQDELVFDGHSFIVDSDGTVVARARQFEQELLVCDLGADCPQAEPLDDVAEVYGALVLGLRDYVRKNGFRHVGVALSGGIDSALVALIAADALGPEQLSCVVMPSPHSSDATQQDARRIAGNLAAELIEIPIADAMGSYEDALGPAFDGGSPLPDSVPTDPARPSEPDLARENIQARIRGNLMMALSNRFGWLVLTTGNKSELSVGYATLYGDMAGGFALIKDVPKTLVYQLVRWRNAQAGEELIPASVIERAPSAELRPDQLDTDSLPPYDVLDRVLEAYVEGDQGRDEIAAAGTPADVVERVIGLVDRAEYKRRQAPPGIRITPKAFGRDRRLPITNRFRG
jgi:NAD+ synthase (glutamine-hydrolysing)